MASKAGLYLDDWQADVLDGALRRQEDGRWAAFEVALIVPRQNGKGSVLEARELHALFREPDCKLILHSAHEFKTAKEAFRRIVTLIKAYPLMERQVDHIRYTTGEEGVELKDGSRLRFVARSSGSGRGFSGDLIILDEAYNLSADMMAAMLPTMSARPDPQLWYTSSAPLPVETSDVLRRLCRRGRSKQSQSLAYFEWCAGFGADLSDHSAWAAANPALGGRISTEFVEKEREALGDDGFARERLGIWSETEQESAIDPRDWDATLNESMTIAKVAAFAVDVTPRQDRTSIAASGLTPSGRVGVELVEHRFGTRWAVDRLIELARQYGAEVVLDPGGPAGTLLPDLTEKQVEPVLVSARQHAQACGALVNDLKERRVEHLSQGPLDEAVAGATKRQLGDLWLWDRRSSSIDISPLVAVTLARWAAAAKAKRRLDPGNYGSLEEVGA